MIENPKILFETLFAVAVDAADAKSVLKDHLPSPPKGRTVVVGAGKGAAQLAAAFEDLYEAPVTGVIVTRYGYATACQSITVLEAAHPVPDAAGERASAALLNAVAGLTPDDLVVALICGGGSSLLPCPPEGFTLADEQGLNAALLASGAPISAMNALRKQFSKIKGGRLAAAAYPAPVLSLVLSDIPGDDMVQVASGPTLPDHRGAAEALAAIDNYRLDLPKRMRDAIATVQAPLPNNPVFKGHRARLIGSARLSLEAAAQRARALGIPAMILSDAIEGEAADIARMHAAIAREIALRDRPFRKPVLLLSGGETTVTLKGNGRGGRNTEFLLALAIELDGMAGVYGFAADTDGIDGSESNAGAFVGPDTLVRLQKLGLQPRASLANNDAFSAFDALGELFSPGPTGTNVNDFRALLIV